MKLFYPKRDDHGPVSLTFRKALLYCSYENT